MPKERVCCKVIVAPLLGFALTDDENALLCICAAIVYHQQKLNVASLS